MTRTLAAVVLLLAIPGSYLFVQLVWWVQPRAFGWFRAWWRRRTRIVRNWSQDIGAEIEATWR